MLPRGPPAAFLFVGGLSVSGDRQQAAHCLRRQRSTASANAPPAHTAQIPSETTKAINRGDHVDAFAWPSNTDRLAGDALACLRILTHPDDSQTCY